MSISKSDILKKIDSLIPAAINYSQNSSGDIDSEKVFGKIKGAIALAILIDENALFYIENIDLILYYHDNIKKNHPIFF